jgi:pimeloyl-ACP methyl ester carboxylesterase
VDDAGDFTLLDQFGHNTFSAELEDLRRVVDALAQGSLDVAPPSSLGLVGHSRGGGVAVLQTARDDRVRALVTWSAISSVERWAPAEQAAWRKAGVKEIENVRTKQKLPLYTDVLDDIAQHAIGQLDIMGAATRVQVPWLLVHGTEDESVSHLEAEALKAANPLESTRLLLVEGAGHTFGAAHPWKGETPTVNEVFDATLGWFAAHLR